MPSIRSNLTVSLVGQGWVAMLQFLMVPVYIRLLGIEGYGLLGFYASLVATVQALDLGLGQTMTREIARYSTVSSTPAILGDLVSTVERTYWGLSAVACCILVLAAPVLVNHVISSHQLTKDTLYVVILMMAALVAIQLTINFYYCSLVGLEKFPAVNVVRAASATAAAVGGVLILIYVHQSLVFLFLWYGCVFLVQAIITRTLVQHYLPSTPVKPKFRFSVLRSLWRFAAGMSGISIVAMMATQLDKWILINLLSLEHFGYYAVASAVSGALFLIISPTFGVLFSRLSSLVAKDDKEALTRVYRAGTQILVVLVVPAALTLSLFSHDILSMWTRNPQVSNQAAPILSILILGTAVNGIMNVTFALQLAYGWTRLALGINLIALIFFIPSIAVLTMKFGAIGAAVAWLGFNLVFAFLAVPVTHAKSSICEVRRWLVNDVLLAVGLTGVTLWLAKCVRPEGMSVLSQLLYIVVSYGIAVLLAILAGSQTREWAKMHVINTLKYSGMR